MTKTEVDALFAPYPESVREIAGRARDLVREVLPGTVEQVDVPRSSSATAAIAGTSA